MDFILFLCFLFDTSLPPQKIGFYVLLYIRVFNLPFFYTTNKSKDRCEISKLSHTIKIFNNFMYNKSILFQTQTYGVSCTPKSLSLVLRSQLSFLTLLYKFDSFLPRPFVSSIVSFSFMSWETSESFNFTVNQYRLFLYLITSGYPTSMSFPTYKTSIYPYLHSTLLYSISRDLLTITDLSIVQLMTSSSVAISILVFL